MIVMGYRSIGVLVLKLQVKIGCYAPSYRSKTWPGGMGVEEVAEEVKHRLAA